MNIPFFSKHESKLQSALSAIKTRGYWSPFSEMPSPRAYGETAAADGEAAFKALLERPFELDQPATGTVGKERSPFGFALNIAFPKRTRTRSSRLHKRRKRNFDERGAESVGWCQSGNPCTAESREFRNRAQRHAHDWSGVHDGLQAGGLHAQDRALEAIAYAWDAMQAVPDTAYWEKPQGKNLALVMEKQFTIVPRGIGLVIGCCTFPTWNGYPGMFADIATGNAVIVKPHPGAILPLAITVRIAREVFKEAGFDPNVVTLLTTDPNDGELVQSLATRDEIRLVDFTGSTVNGNWLESNARQAQVYTEKAGVNQIVIDSADDVKSMARNIAFSLALYSGQMCTAPQNIYVPRDGIQTADGVVSFDAVAQAIADAVKKLMSDPAKAVELTGAIQNNGVLDRIAQVSAFGSPLLDSQPLAHPMYPEAKVSTPALRKLDAQQESRCSRRNGLVRLHS